MYRLAELPVLPVGRIRDLENASVPELDALWACIRPPELRAELLVRGTCLQLAAESATDEVRDAVHSIRTCAQKRALVVTTPYMPSNAMLDVSLYDRTWAQVRQCRVCLPRGSAMRTRKTLHAQWWISARARNSASAWKSCRSVPWRGKRPSIRACLYIERDGRFVLLLRTKLAS
jgi:hypothetical protein